MRPAQLRGHAGEPAPAPVRCRGRHAESSHAQHAVVPRGLDDLHRAPDHSHYTVCSAGLRRQHRVSRGQLHGARLRREGRVRQHVGNHHVRFKRRAVLRQREGRLHVRRRDRRRHQRRRDAHDHHVHHNRVPVPAEPVQPLRHARGAPDLHVPDQRRFGGHGRLGLQAPHPVRRRIHRRRRRPVPHRRRRDFGELSQRERRDHRVQGRLDPPEHVQPPFAAPDRPDFARHGRGHRVRHWGPHVVRGDPDGAGKT